MATKRRKTDPSILAGRNGRKQGEFSHAKVAKDAKGISGNSIDPTFASFASFA